MNSPNPASILTLLRHFATGTLRGGRDLAGGSASGTSRHSATGPATRSQRERDVELVRRIHQLRTLGMALGFLAAASVLQLNAAGTAWWLLLAANTFVWPHLALLLALRSANRRQAEIRNLTIDSALGGLWIAVMQFNLLPTVLVLTMLSADKISVGGLRLLVRTLSAMGAACALSWAWLGYPVNIATPMSVIVACMPVLVVYPIAISGTMYALARKVAQQNHRLEDLGRTDILTGLANRRQCFAEAEVELARHLRTGRPASLIVLDVDYFKSINDQYGHPVGDEVLCGLAMALRACCRTIDTPARYGGDEFMLILPETELRGAEELAERIRTQVRSLAIERAPGLRCTVSLGGAEAGPGITDVGAWVQRADVALYRAKTGGRDRFEAAG